MEGIMHNLKITVKHNCMCLTLAVVKTKFCTLFSLKNKCKGSVFRVGLRKQYAFTMNFYETLGLFICHL